MKKLITILFLSLFVSSLCLDAYSNLTENQGLQYEMVDNEPENESEEDESQEELKKDDFLDTKSQLTFFSSLSKKEFLSRQYLWKLEIHEIILPPPEQV